MAEEFDLIETYFQPLSVVRSTELGIGDDGAVLDCPVHHQLVVVTDTLIEGVHFPESTSADAIAWKALAVNLSDLAAMGATPAFYSLALSLPQSKNNQAWLFSFAQGLSKLANLYAIPLIGGDTTKHDKLVVTITAHGWVPSLQMIRRSGAEVGDSLYVSGRIGDAGLAVPKILNHDVCPDVLRQALDYPQPRVSLGQLLLKYANSAIDVSDGLLADLHHILTQSSVAAQLNYSMMPFSDLVKQHTAASQDWLFPVTAGDDYELCFTVPKDKEQAFLVEAELLDTDVTKIGEIVEDRTDEKIIWIDTPEGFEAGDKRLGYRHYD